jgi:glycosidase
MVKPWFVFCLITSLTLFAAACGVDSSDDTNQVFTPEKTPTESPNFTSTPESHLPFSTKLEGSEGYPWWNDRVFYEIFLRSFYDSDGDGIGDFQGLIQKLDYLNDGDPETDDDLGVTGIWLMPINPSPSYHGYDVTDYLEINPDYGTMEDFNQFLEEAHSRGIVVIIDLVLNHSSTEHPWFQASTDPASKYREYYNWSESKPPQVGWHEWRESGDYYYGLFWYGMPDLNYGSQAVTDEMFAVVRFWLEEVGVDGFRLDAAKHLIEDGAINDNTPATHDWYQSFHDFYKEITPNGMTIGEIWDISFNVVEYLQGDELDIAFNFDLAEAYLHAAKTGTASRLYSMIRLDIPRYPPLQFGAFLTNHDQNRVMSQLASEDKSRVAAALLLTGPGVPFIYYGEELGMMGIKPDEDIRTPMQWRSIAHGGFTTGTPWRSVNRDFWSINVELESASETSLLSWYRKLIHIRNSHPALRVGAVYGVDVESETRNIFSMVRASQDETLLVLINLSGESVDSYSLGCDQGALADGRYQLISLLDDSVIAPLLVENGTFSGYIPVPSLEGYQVLVMQLVRE